MTLVLLVITLVLTRTFTRNSFRYDAPRWAEPSVSGANLLTEEQAVALDGKILIVTPDEPGSPGNDINADIISVKPESVVERDNLSEIREHRGPVLLYSKDISVSARVWMVLSELGIRNIFILNQEEDQ